MIESVRLVIEDNDAYLIYIDRGREVEVRPEWKERKGRDLLARALGIKAGTPLTVLDATMGLAGDAVHLQSLGVNVTAIERHGDVVKLVDWWLKHSGRPKFEVIHADACDWLAETDRRFDVIYLDPIFPGDRSGKARKTMDVLQVLEAIGDGAGQEAKLFATASLKARRIVVKRGLKSPPIVNHPKPAFVLKGRLIRYDVYTVA